VHLSYLRSADERVKQRGDPLTCRVEERRERGLVPPPTGQRHGGRDDAVDDGNR
jgi:hypothetical protein